MNTYVKATPEFGRGIYTITPISKGSVIAQCEIIVMDEQSSFIVSDTCLVNYVFKFKDNQDCIVLGEGSLFNHKEVPNVAFKLETINNRSLMVFYALDTIKPDEQLFINYSQDTAVDTDKYMSAKSLMG
jgi:hypothetical protein